MAYDMIWEDMGILVKFTGTVTEQEVLTVNDQIYGDKRFETITYQIADYTGVINNQIAPRNAKVIGILDKSSSRWNHNRIKNIVITKDENFIPIVETYFQQFEGMHWECRIFETLEMAHNWISSGISDLRLV